MSSACSNYAKIDGQKRSNVSKYKKNVTMKKVTLRQNFNKTADSLKNQQQNDWLNARNTNHRSHFKACSKRKVKVFLTTLNVDRVDYYNLKA